MLSTLLAHGAGTISTGELLSARISAEDTSTVTDCVPVMSSAEARDQSLLNTPLFSQKYSGATATIPWSSTVAVP